MIKSVLIANRGEIACRIIRTAKRLGLHTVALFSEPDTHALHVKMADEAYLLPGEVSRDTYLNIPKILSLCQEARVDAIHPGYGFLAENAEFARQCEARGLIFIGPSSDVIARMGLKDAAKSIVSSLNLPLLPGFHGEIENDEAFLAVAKEIGFPILLKAAAGGGGKGMRIVANESEFLTQLASAKREALASFGSDKLLLEKYLLSPRHIEIQIAADQHGNVVHLFERDCSIQRRYQKIIEEAPAPHFSENLRKKMTDAAVKIAKEIHYTGVGTLEFLVDDREQFYFMEMNTRLQVEHPITEMITGVDLVEWQFKIAEGARLPMTQSQIQRRGHAIEARLCAENPWDDYLPSSGKIPYLKFSQEPQVRVETGIRAPGEVSRFYDSMIAKIVAWDEARTSAISRLENALQETQLIGITTNREFLLNILKNPDYQAGKINTHFIPQHLQVLLKLPDFSPYPWVVLAVLYLFVKAKIAPHVSPWMQTNCWQLNAPPAQRLRVYHGLDGFPVEVLVHGRQLVMTTQGMSVEIQDWRWDPVNFNLSVEINHEWLDATIIAADGKLTIFYQGHSEIIYLTPPIMESESDVHGNLHAPIPGIVANVLVKAGDVVKKGQVLMLLEAMKMEHAIKSPLDGRIQQIPFAKGDQVAEGDVLFILE